LSASDRPALAPTRHPRAALFFLDEVHSLELEAVRVEKEHGIIALTVTRVGGRRVDDFNAFREHEGVELVDLRGAFKLEGVVMKADVAGAVRVAQSFGVGLRDPEHRGPVVPADDFAELPFALEAHEGQQAVVEPLRARELGHANGEVIDADNANHQPGSWP